MGKPRSKLPSLARTSVTNTCIDTTNVSRNPFFTSSPSPPRVPPLVSTPLATTSHGPSSLTYGPSFQHLSAGFAFPIPLPSFLHHNHSVSVGQHQDSWPSQPWHISFSGPPPKPLPEGKERAALWKKLTPSEQDDLLLERVDFYDLKAKYDALEQAVVQETPQIVEPTSQCVELDTISSDESEQYCDDSISEVTSFEDQNDDDDSQELEHLDTTISSFPVDDDVLSVSDFEIEDEFGPITSNLVIRGRYKGSNQPIVRHGYVNVIHYRRSTFVDEDKKIEDVKTAPLYNFKKRRRK